MANLNKFQDERGILVPIEFQDLPFEAKRIFYITDVPENSWRGGHAHFNTKQLLICIKGRVLVKLEKPESIQEIILEENQDCLINEMVWDSQKFLEPGTVLLVICSTSFDSNDYISDYEKFVELSKGTLDKSH